MAEYYQSHSYVEFARYARFSGLFATVSDFPPEVYLFFLAITLWGEPTQADNNYPKCRFVSGQRGLQYLIPLCRDILDPKPDIEYFSKTAHCLLTHTVASFIGLWHRTCLINTLACR